MSTIIDFTYKETKNFLSRIEKDEFWLDAGGESDCYLINGHVYKIYGLGFNLIDNTICKDDLDLESILFPNELYMYDKRIFACKTDKFIPENKIKADKLQKGEFPDLDSIKNALEQLIKDIYVLSRNHIYADDLAWKNLLFDGEKFYIIDTLRYEHHDNRPVEQIYKENINLLIYECFEPFAYVYYINYKSSESKQHEIDEEVFDKLDELTSYIKELAKQVQEEYKDKEVQKIKRP